MDVRFALHCINFVWDENKAQAYVTKHDGVTFEQAAEALFDPFVKIFDASTHDEGRDAIIGMDTRWKLLFVVHITVEEDRIRIISARKTTRQERQYYED